MNKIFVIMPFSKTSKDRTEKYWDDFFNINIKKAIDYINRQMLSFRETERSADYSVLNRYDCYRSTAKPSNIIEGIIDSIKTADIVIAVLTDHNPNVFYELGTRHVLKRGTIMLVDEEYKKKIPADINNYGVVKYSGKIGFTNEFAKQIARCIHEIERNSVPDSPALSYYEKSNYGKHQEIVAVHKNGFPSINLTSEQKDFSGICRMVFLEVCDDIFSADIRKLFGSKECRFELLVCRRTEVLEFRAQSLGMTYDEYIGRCGNFSKQFLCRCQAQGKFTIKEYDVFPFGLYFQLGSTIWFCPLWNKNRDITAAFQLVLEVRAESALGEQLCNNFMALDRVSRRLDCGDICEDD